MAVDSQRFLTHGAKGDKNVALNVALNTKYLSDKIGVSRKTIQKSDES